MVLRAQVVQQHEALRLVPFQHPRHVQPGLRPSGRRPCTKGRQSSLSGGASMMMRLRAASLGVDAQVAAEAGVGRGQPQRRGQQAVRAARCRPAMGKAASRCGSAQVTGGGWRRGGGGGRGRSWIIHSTNPPAPARVPRRRQLHTSLMHDLTSEAFRARFALTPVALVACALLQRAGARRRRRRAAAGAASPARMLREDIPAAAREQLPTFVVGRPHLRAAPTWRP